MYNTVLEGLYGQKFGGGVFKRLNTENWLSLLRVSFMLLFVITIMQWGLLGWIVYTI
jgi:hypothetical protein